ncbi:Ig-like domain-containing protein, partial [Helcococcus ovis]
DIEYNSKHHEPKFENAEAGKQVVIGKGISGDKVTIKDSKGKELAKDVLVNKDGKFEAKLTRALEPEEVIKAIAKTGKEGAEKTSTEAEAKVTYVAKDHDLTVNPLIEGKDVLSGKGKSGDEVVVRDNKGNEIG